MTGIDYSLDYSNAINPICKMTDTSISDKPKVSSRVSVARDSGRRVKYEDR